MSSKIRTAVVTMATSVGLIAGRRAAEAGWRAYRHEEPPAAGDVPDDASLRDLFVWAGVLVACTAIASRAIVTVAERIIAGADS